MSGYWTTNPCFCNNVTTTSQPVSCKSGVGECFCLCNYFIKGSSDDAVAPCGVLGTFDLNDIPKNFSVCGDNEVVFERIMYDQDFFSLLNVSSNGTLEWKIKEGTGKYVGSVTVKASCGDRGAHTTIEIGKKDLCKNVSCIAGEICNECDGTCIPDPGAGGSVPVTSGNTVIVTGEETAFLLQAGRSLDYIIVQNGVDQNVTVGTTPGGDELANENYTVANQPWARLDIVEFADGTDKLIYLNATDAIFTIYTR